MIQCFPIKRCVRKIFFLVRISCNFLQEIYLQEFPAGTPARVFFESLAQELQECAYKWGVGKLQTFVGD